MDINYENALQRLKDMPDEMVYAKDIAPILRMKPDVIIKHVKDGIWDPDGLGKYVLSGDRVKFFRRDFLQKCGFMPPDPPERTMIQAIDDLREDLHDIGLILLAQLSIGPLLRLDELKQKEKDRQRGNTDGLRKEVQT